MRKAVFALLLFAGAYYLVSLQQEVSALRQDVAALRGDAPPAPPAPAAPAVEPVEPVEPVQAKAPATVAKEEVQELVSSLVTDALERARAVKAEALGERWTQAAEEKAEVLVDRMIEQGVIAEEAATEALDLLVGEAMEVGQLKADAMSGAIDPEAAKEVYQDLHASYQEAMEALLGSDAAQTVNDAWNGK